jgi:hypothetical protein
MNHRLRETGKGIRDLVLTLRAYVNDLVNVWKALNTCFAFNELVEERLRRKSTSLDLLFLMFYATFGCG